MRGMAVSSSREVSPGARAYSGPPGGPHSARVTRRRMKSLAVVGHRMTRCRNPATGGVCSPSELLAAGDLQISFRTFDLNQIERAAIEIDRKGPKLGSGRNRETRSNPILRGLEIGPFQFISHKVAERMLRIEMPSLYSLFPTIYRVFEPKLAYFRDLGGIRCLRKPIPPGRPASSPWESPDQPTCLWGPKSGNQEERGNGLPQTWPICGPSGGYKIRFRRWNDVPFRQKRT